MVFGIDTVMYTITSFALNMVSEKNKSYMKLIAASQIIFVFSVIFMGPLPILPDEIKYICFGILLSGLGGACTNNFAVPAMDELSKNIEGIAEEDKGELKNIISSINTGAFGLGSILGPILASFFSSLFDNNNGYKGSYESIFIFVIIVAIL